MKKTLNLALGAVVVFGLSGCMNSQESLGADVYDVRELNTQQNAKTVEIISIMPAKVAVENKDKQTAQLVGGVLGAVVGGVVGHNVGSGSDAGTLAGTAAGGALGVAAGSMVDDKKIVEGVTLAYKQGTKLKTSTQAGRACQFKLGTALLVSSANKHNETRIQPNSTCPTKK